MSGAADHVRVPFLDLAREGRALEAELVDATVEVIRAGCYLAGPRIDRLERALSERVAGRPVVAVGSGTQALEALLLAHQIGPGDEVITTPASFYATAFAVQRVGARVVFADIDPGTCQLDPVQVEAAITPRTRAVLAVHLYGRPAPVAALRRLTEARGLLLLEDAAQAIGARAHGRPVGTWGDGAIFSFYPTKNLGAVGDAGAVVLPDEELAERVRRARFLGWSGTRDVFDTRGLSGRMDELQAALLLVKLAHLDAWTARRRELAGRYEATLPRERLLAPLGVDEESVHHLFVVRHPRRDRVAALLAEHGVGSLVHYRVPLHRQPALGPCAQELPYAERWGEEVLSLPLHPYLTEDEVEHVLRAALFALEAA